MLVQSCQNDERDLEMTVRSLDFFSAQTYGSALTQDTQKHSFPSDTPDISIHPDVLERAESGAADVVSKH